MHLHGVQGAGQVVLRDLAMEMAAGEPAVGRRLRLDGSPAAANTITGKRAVFHGALAYAVEFRLLPANPISLVRWRAPRAAVALRRATSSSLHAAAAR
jgi:hypothetical protein